MTPEQEAIRAERERILKLFDSYEVKLLEQARALRAEGLQDTFSIEAQLDTVRLLRHAVAP